MAKVLLHILPAEGYFTEIAALIRARVSNGTHLIYVTAGKPYADLVGLFEGNGIDTSKIFFVDCITKHLSMPSPEADNCLFLDNPIDLTEMSIAINTIIKKLPSPKALLLDSLSTLFIYNNENLVGRFSNFLINRLRSYKVDTVFTVLESDADKKAISIIKLLVDEVKNDK